MENKLRLHLLLNPVAGNGLAKEKFIQLTKLLKNKNIKFDYEVSKKTKDLIFLAQNFVNHCNSENTLLLVIGGDGSFNEVLNGIKLSKTPSFPFTYLPAGSGNDFARAANLETNPEKLIFKLLNSYTYQKVDCGFFKINTNNQKAYFANNFGIGFDALVVHESNHSHLKRKLNQLHCGNLVYAINIINGLRKQDTFSVKITSNNKISTFKNVYFCTITNQPYFGGGIKILPQANIFNKNLDLVIVQKPSISKFIWLFMKLLVNGSHVYDQHFHHLESEFFNIQINKKEHVQVDGEEYPLAKYNVDFKIDHFNLIR